MNEKFICTISGEDIYQTDFYGNSKPIGKTLEAYSELEAVTTEYYNKLVELGVICPPKTQEELMGQLQDNMASMASLIETLTAKVKELETGGSKQNNTDVEQTISERRDSKRRGSSTADAGGNT
jgi:GH35 family endo-1,4-beta-xylanase